MVGWGNSKMDSGRNVSNDDGDGEGKVIGNGANGTALIS